MGVHVAEIRVSTHGSGDITDISAGVEEVVGTSGARDGIVNVFVAHSTAAIALMECESGAMLDFKELMDRLAPPEGDYHHNRSAGDTNAHSHMQAALLGPSETIPLKDGQLQAGTWQQIVLVDFDDQPRERRVIVQVIA